MKIILYILIIVCAVLLGYILLLTVSALLVNPKREYMRNSRYYRWLLDSATAVMVKVLHIRVYVSGLEKLPTGNFLIVSNHRSNFDPILTWFVLREHNLAYISKEENFHIPIFGRLIRKCCFLSIDRTNARNALKTIDKAAELLTDNTASIGVYPEGTRSKDGVLLPFHDGVFKIAQRAGVPIVVMTIEGTEAIHKNVPFKRTEVYLKVLSVLSAGEIADVRTSNIGSQVRDIMENQLLPDSKQIES